MNVPLTSDFLIRKKKPMGFLINSDIFRRVLASVFTFHCVVWVCQQIHPPLSACLSFRVLRPCFLRARASAWVVASLKQSVLIKLGLYSSFDLSTRRPTSHTRQPPGSGIRFLGAEGEIGRDALCLLLRM